MIFQSPKNGEKYSGAAIYYAISNDEGQTFHTNIKAADHSSECRRVGIAMDKDGRSVVVCRHIFGKNIRDHVKMRLDGNVNNFSWSTDKEGYRLINLFEAAQ